MTQGLKIFLDFKRSRNRARSHFLPVEVSYGTHLVTKSIEVHLLHHLKIMESWKSHGMVTSAPAGYVYNILCLGLSLGGVTTIYAGTGCAISYGAFFEQTINFEVSFLVKSHGFINDGVSFKKNHPLVY